jgi:ribosome-associated protein
MKNDTLNLLNSISQSIYNKKGFNILVIDVRNVSNMTDYLIIAEGTVDRHVKAIYRHIIESAHSLGYREEHVEGNQIGDWVVIDFVDVVVHVFIPDLREKYALEKLWKQGAIVDVELVPSQQVEWE